MALLSVSAHDIDAAGTAVDADLPTDWLDRELGVPDLAIVAPGHVNARLSRSGADVVVRGRVRAELTTPCARCLEPAPVHVDAELALVLEPHRAHDGKKPNGDARPSAKGSGPKEPEYEFHGEEADVDTYDGETVILDPFIREAILLEIPNFPLCSEACPGIRPAASAEAPEPAVDPRLRPLGALKAKLNKKTKE